MKAGNLNTLVTIQAPATGQDAIGQPLAGWSDLVKVWGNVRHGSGMEAVRAGAPVSVVKASIRIRRRDDVTNAMRVLVGSTVYEVEAVIQDEVKREYTDLVCQVVR